MDRTQVLAGLANQVQAKAATDAAWAQLGQEQEVAYKELDNRFTLLREVSPDAAQEAEEAAYTALEEQFTARRDVLEAADADAYTFSNVVLYTGEPLYVDVQDASGAHGSLTVVTNFVSDGTPARQASFYIRRSDSLMAADVAYLGVALVDEPLTWYHLDSLQEAKDLAFDYVANDILPSLPQISSEEGNALLSLLQSEILPF